MEEGASSRSYEMRRTFDLTVGVVSMFLGFMVALLSAVGDVK